MIYSYLLASTNNFLMAKIIAGISVVFFAIYIVMSVVKYKVKKASEPKGRELSAHSVTFKYGEGSEKCTLRFYTDGIYFQKADYKSMFVPYMSISAVDKPEGEENTYRISFFMPNGRESVTVCVISEVCLDKEFDIDADVIQNECITEDEHE
ncbi:MAG: hypothetical protein E7315_00450 [Clostridiales bacterium]|nr:hypothetical protein [Clostridiales bacterium]